jgi:hypothetical protein
VSYNPLIVISIAMLASQAVEATPVSDRLIESYTAATGQTADPVRGERLWRSEQAGRSCTSCHGRDPRAPGQHIKTRKRIEPMAVSVNSQRLSDETKIEKWFLRNCKWTLNRECSLAEKADILAWLATQ